MVPGARAGTFYKFRLDERGDFPDPASRFQPTGPHGPSQIVDARQYEWTDAGWPGPTLAGAVLYEIHVGTFTPEGTYTAARAHFAELSELGISVIELMPVAEFPGRFGWGYDGVALFAPYHHYGALPRNRPSTPRRHTSSPQSPPAYARRHAQTARSSSRNTNRRTRSSSVRAMPAATRSMQCGMTTFTTARSSH